MPDGRLAVLKIGAPTPELANELNALSLYNGKGAAKVLAADREMGSMVLEYLHPGSPLSHPRDDEAATRVASRLMRTLWRAVSEEFAFPTVDSWMRRRSHLDAGRDGLPIPLPLADRASNILTELAESTAQSLRVHGDLHHWYILQAHRESCVAIDPKGMCGIAMDAWLALEQDPNDDYAAHILRFAEWLVPLT